MNSRWEPEEATDNGHNRQQTKSVQLSACFRGGAQHRRLPLAHGLQHGIAVCTVIIEHTVTCSTLDAPPNNTSVIPHQSRASGLLSWKPTKLLLPTAKDWNANRAPIHVPNRVKRTDPSSSCGWTSSWLENIRHEEVHKRQRLHPVVCDGFFMMKKAPSRNLHFSSPFMIGGLLRTASGKIASFQVRNAIPHACHRVEGADSLK